MDKKQIETLKTLNPELWAECEQRVKEKLKSWGLKNETIKQKSN